MLFDNTFVISIQQKVFECIDSNTTQMAKHLTKKHNLLPPPKTKKEDEGNKDEVPFFFCKEQQDIIDSNLYVSLVY
jgi:hypothetical protein